MPIVTEVLLMIGLLFDLVLEVFVEEAVVADALRGERLIEVFVMVTFGDDEGEEAFVSKEGLESIVVAVTFILGVIFDFATVALDPSDGFFVCSISFNFSLTYFLASSRFWLF